MRFSAAITNENARGFAAVIPDIKCVSPKEGDLLRGRNPVKTAKLLIDCGAPVLSVVTENEHFGGSPALLHSIAGIGVPVLRKDFITDEAQLHETLEMGAAAVLLICATTEPAILARLYARALQLGLEPLVEVCSTEEMRFARDLGAQIVGINNRNIASLEFDSGGPSRTAALAREAPRGALLISESGIVTPQDAKQAIATGANALLVGTALWQADDMAAAYRSLRVERRDDSCVQS